MQFVSDYVKAIDFIALAALVVIAAASLSRGGTIWLFSRSNRRCHLGCKSVVRPLLIESSPLCVQ